MDGLLRVVGTLCAANLVAMLAFVGWLINSDRLDAARVNEIRAMLSETISDEAARVRTETDASDAEAKAEAEAARFELDPVSAEAQLQERRAQTDMTLMSVQRMRRSVEDLQRQLDRQRRAIDMERANLERDRIAYAEMRAKNAAQEGDVEFQRAVEVLAQTSNKSAKAMLQLLIDQGDSDQAVSYLDALDVRKRSSVLNEWFVDGQTDVALELLEALRTRGIETSPEAVDEGGPGAN